MLLTWPFLFAAFLQYLVDIPLSNATLVSWCAMQVFQRTINRGSIGHDDDESNHHVLFSYESEHPYSSRGRRDGRVTVPGADRVRVTMDKRCRTEGDVLAFYKSEDMSAPTRKYL
jgi:hypothetical protein